MPRRAVELGTKCCERCGQTMSRKRFGERLEDISAFRKRRYCSLACANKRGNWGTSSTARHRVSSRTRKPTCEICDRADHLHVHHMDGNYHNNAPINLQTLCIACHMRHHKSQKRSAA